MTDNNEPVKSSGKNFNGLLPLELRSLLGYFGLGVFLLVPITTLLSVIFSEPPSPPVIWILLGTMVHKLSSLARGYRGISLAIMSEVQLLGDGYEVP
jgi:hypothetical protein